jgi:hypothetical protein
MESTLEDRLLLGMVWSACSSSTWEAESGGSGVQSLMKIMGFDKGFIVRSCLKEKKILKLTILLPKRVKQSMYLTSMKKKNKS